MLDVMKARGALVPDVAGALREEYEASLRNAEDRIASLHMDAEELKNEELLATKRQLLTIEKDALLDAHKRGLIGDEAAEHLLRDVDARLVGLDDAHDCS